MYATFRNIIGIAAVSLLLVACVASPRYQDRHRSGEHHQSSDGHQARDGYRSSRCQRCGTIEYIEEVAIRERTSGGGAVLGAIIGGVLGNQIGSGSGRRAATVAGAVAGGMIGHNTESRRDGRDYAYRFEIRLDDGRWAEVVQRDHRDLRVGDRVVIRQNQLHRTG